MRVHNFIFTYAISHSGLYSEKKCESIKKLKNIVRERRIKEWTKLDAVANTFIGEFVLNSNSISAKREEVRQIVRTVFEDMMFEIEVYSDVVFGIAMLVDGLGEYIEFKV